MSDFDEAASLARAEQATPGPWTAWNRGVGFEIHLPDGEPIPEGMRTDIGRAKDAEFIAAARLDIPEWGKLVAELRERAEKAEARIEAALIALDNASAQDSTGTMIDRLHMHRALSEDEPTEPRDPERYEYAVCYRAGNGNVIAVTTPTTWRQGAVAELAACRVAEADAGGDPDRVFTGRRPVPLWTPDEETNR